MTDTEESRKTSSNNVSSIFEGVNEQQNISLTVEERINKTKCKDINDSKLKLRRSGRDSPVTNAIMGRSSSKSSPSLKSCSPEMNELDSFLNESIRNASKIKQPWNNLTRDEKISKLETYAAHYSESHDLSLEETENLKLYLVSAMDKKRLTKVKEIIYDKENQKITSIPILIYNPASPKRFTLKRLDNHISSLKSLTPKKNRTSKVPKVASSTSEGKKTRASPIEKSTV